MSETGKKNALVILFLVMLDFISFSIIFPVMPDLLLFYVKNQGFFLDKIIIDGFLNMKDALIRFLPVTYFEDDVVILFGSLISSVYALLQFVSSPFWGRLSDKIGRKKVLLFTNAGLALSYLVWFFAFSFSLFIISRLLAGFMSGNVGVASAALSDLSGEKKRTYYMGLLGMAIGLGFVLGPLLGGAMYYLENSVFSWHLFHPFTFSSLSAFLLSSTGILLNIIFLKETRHVSGERDIAISEKTGKSAIFYFLLINFLYMVAFTSFEFIFTFLLKFLFALEPHEIGVIFTFLGILISLSQGIAGRVISGRYRDKHMMVAGVFVVSLSFFLLYLGSHHIGLVLLSLIPLSAGNGLFQPAIAGFVSKFTPEDSQGKVLGLLRSTASFSRAVGPLAGGFLFWILDIHYFLIISVVMFVLVIMVARY